MSWSKGPKQRILGQSRNRERLHPSPAAASYHRHSSQKGLQEEWDEDKEKNATHRGTTFAEVHQGRAGPTSVQLSFYHLWLLKGRFFFQEPVSKWLAMYWRKHHDRAEPELLKNSVRSLGHLKGDKSLGEHSWRTPGSAGHSTSVGLPEVQPLWPGPPSRYHASILPSLFTFLLSFL